MIAVLNWVDYLILGVFIVSILAGLLRGLIKEIISLLTWIAATIAGLLLAPRVAAYFTNSAQVQSTIASADSTIGINAAHSVSMVSTGVSFMVIFVVTLICGTIFNYFVNRTVDAGGISVGNRLWGGVFGLGRGFLVNILIVFMVQFSPLGQQPAWAQSQFVQYFQLPVSILDQWLQPQLQDLKSKIGQQPVGLQSMRSYFTHLYQSWNN